MPPGVDAGAAARSPASSGIAADRSLITKRSVTIKGHRTSVSVEDAFWNVLRAIAGERGEALGALVGEIDAARGGDNLSSAIRLFVLDWALGRSRAV